MQLKAEYTLSKRSTTELCPHLRFPRKAQLPTLMFLFMWQGGPQCSEGTPRREKQALVMEVIRCKGQQLRHTHEHRRRWGSVQKALHPV